VEALERGIEFRRQAEQHYVTLKRGEFKPRGQSIERRRSSGRLHLFPLDRKLPGNLDQRAGDALRRRVRFVKAEFLLAVFPNQKDVGFLIADGPTQVALRCLAPPILTEPKGAAVQK